MTHRPAWLDRTLADCPHIDPAIPDDAEPESWTPPVWLYAVLVACLIAICAGIALAIR